MKNTMWAWLGKVMHSFPCIPFHELSPSTYTRCPQRSCSGQDSKATPWLWGWETLFWMLTSGTGNSGFLLLLLLGQSSTVVTNPEPITELQLSANPYRKGWIYCSITTKKRNSTYEIAEKLEQDQGKPGQWQWPPLPLTGTLVKCACTNCVDSTLKDWCGKSQGQRQCVSSLHWLMK